MFCLPVDVPEELCKIDDELKAIYHSKNTVCIWIFESRDDRNNFINATAGMDKATRAEYYKKKYSFE